MFKLLISAMMLIGASYALDSRAEATGNHTALLSQFGPYGGRRGNAFTDSAFAVGQRITGIDVTYGSQRIRSIRVQYTGNLQPAAHGKTTGTAAHFAVYANETITGINVRYGSKIRGIQFITSRGRISSFYGKEKRRSSSVDIPRGLKFISGRSRNRVNQLTFHS